ncbi:MAG: protein kinase [Chloroflexi bacterium]|nr:protein kinase [Chloroflexota bacterium]
MASLEPGARIGGYEIVGEIGRGGMATVYRAHQPSLDRYVAMKALRSAENADLQFRERFRQEARLIARLCHPNIVQVYDLIEQGDQLYLVMELVEGTSLRDRLGGALDPQQALAIIAQVGAALDLAHANGIVHRDVKPSNVLLDAHGRALLTDFGIARLMGAKTGLTGAQIVLGTPDYMSPEQAAGHTVGAAADIYALGVMAFEMVTGQLPFRGDTTLAVMRAHVQDPVPRASEANHSLPQAVDVVLDRAMAKEPGERYATGAELATELRQALTPTAELTRETRASTPGVVAARPSLPAVSLPSGTDRKRSRTQTVATFGILGVVLAGAILFVVLGSLANGGIGPQGREAGAPPTATPPKSAAMATSQVGAQAVSDRPAEGTATAPRPSPAASATPVPTPLSKPAPTATRAPTPLPSVAPTAIAVSLNPPIHMLASRDGISFADRAEPPDVQGLLLSAISVGPRQIRLYVSDLATLRLRSWLVDAAGGWTAEATTVRGAPAGMVYGNVIPLADGTFRLYYLAQNGPANRSAAQGRDIVLDGLILSARSRDGVTFDQEAGVRFVAPGVSVLSAAQVRDQWMLFYRISGESILQGARSTDGLDFKRDANVAIPAPWINVTEYDGLLRFLRFTWPPPRLQAHSSSDGVTWAAGEALDVSFQDGTGPAAVLVVRGSDGLYRLFYSWQTLPTRPG